MKGHPKVTVLQHRLLHYRVELFERIRLECERRGIQFRLVHGQPSHRESLRKDTGVIAWADRVRNRWIPVLARDLLWQPLPRELRDSDLTVIMQENRILSNYPLLLKRYFGGTRIAYWGHGKNFQSEAPTGLRERWKSFWLTQVDWWFAYTNLTKRILVEQGVPEDRITCLDNAIDDDAFIAELRNASDATLEAISSQLGLAPGSPLAIFCGSIYPDKRLDLLADAAERIHAAIPAFRLVVIGDGPSRPGLEARLAGRDWARCVGVEHGPRKAAYFKLAKVVLNPGVVGLHVLEAFCAGLPLFTTTNDKHGPEIEYLEHGKNGFVISGGAEAYADAVISLLRDRARYAAVAAAAREAARAYTLDNMVRNFVQGIQTFLDSDAKAPARRA